MPPTIAAGASRQELDDQLSPSRSAKDAAGVIESWGSESDQARHSPGIRSFLDLAYGLAANQKLDVYTGSAEEGGLRPIFVFIHGGFWQQGSKDSSAFPAPAFVAANWVYIAAVATRSRRTPRSRPLLRKPQRLRFIRLHGREFGGDRTGSSSPVIRPAAICKLYG